VINALSDCGNLDIETNLAKSDKFEIKPSTVTSTVNDVSTQLLINNNTNNYYYK